MDGSDATNSRRGNSVTKTPARLAATTRFCLPLKPVVTPLSSITGSP
jgi:hypothetical protein